MIANLESIVSAVVFHSADSFSFAGHPSTEWTAPQSTLVQTLQKALYAHCYTREFKGKIEQFPTSTTTDNRAWLDLLSAANASVDRWEQGWQIEHFLPNGQIQARKGTAARLFWPGEFMTHGAYGLQPQPGTPISVFFPRESRNSQAGFYFVFGETQMAAEEECPTVRYYWNVNQQGAAHLIRLLTSTLNRYQVPFRFKIVNHPAALNRCDAAVLYIGRRFYRIAADINVETHARIFTGLDEPTPLFTLPLRKGLAFAEDPGTGNESFGMSRCRLLAEGLWLAFTEGRMQTPDRLARISEHFAAAGTSLERPYLNTSSIQSYEFPQ